MSGSDPKVVAIDGPAGAGKSTVARRVADALGYRLVDTGALYRVVAYEALRRDLPLDDGEAVAEVARELEFRYEVREGDEVLCFDGRTAGDEIRTPEVSDATSRVSSLPEVREALLDVQRKLGRRGPSVLEGRDIGTVVFPDAEAKIFLTASPEERARRRLEDLEADSDPPDYHEVLADIRERDRRDRNRDNAPLKRADDAVVVDSTDLDIDEVVDRILEAVDD